MGFGEVGPDQLSIERQGEAAAGGEAALREALVLERKARARAEAADAAKSELLATVSHELRTPMGAVICMAELLLAGPLEETQRRYAETLQQSARSLLTVLNDILDFSKLDAGIFELDAAPFDLRELLDGVGAVLAVEAEAKGLAGSLKISPRVPRFVIGDAGRLRQILLNLISNAVKFTAEGSIRCDVGAGIENGRSFVRFDVTDTGVGFDVLARDRLFQPYQQLNPKVSQDYGGTGLGLSIARQLAELMEGEIGAESEPGLGSRFWLRLPLETATTQPASREVGLRETPLSGDGGLKGRLLVVEDNGINRMLIGAYLDEFGLAYEMAESGEEALRMLRLMPFDLVLMDIMMPGMDGLETTQAIRALPGPQSAVPIVALTANAMKGDRENYLHTGMNAYVSKPIRGRELYEQIAAFLEAEADARPAGATS